MGITGVHWHGSIPCIPILQKQEKKIMSREDLQNKLAEKAEIIVNALARGHDVEIRTTANGISVIEISKKVISK